MKLSLFFATLLLATGLQAQNHLKKSLDIEDFAHWKLIQNQEISNNGKYVVYEVNPQKGDGVLIVDDNGKSDTIARGKGAEISPDNDFVIFTISQPEDTIRNAKIEGLKKDKFPKDSLGIYFFKKKETIKFPRLVGFKIPEENAAWIAFLQEPRNEKSDTVETGSKEKKQPGNTLVLYDVSSSDTLNYRRITEYSYSKNGRSLYFVQQDEDSTGTGSKIYRLDTRRGNVTEQFFSEGWIKEVTSDNQGEQFAFIHSADTVKEKVWSLYHGSADAQAEKIVDEFTQGMPIGWSPSENGKIWFSEDGLNLYLGTAESPEQKEEEKIPDDEKPSVDIWNWNDIKLQTQQKVEYEKEKKRTWDAVYHVNRNEFIQLADLNINRILTIKKGNADIGLGMDETPYLRESSWTGTNNRDYYIVDFETGIKRMILAGKSYARMSPGGKYVIWYEPADSSFYSISTDLNDTDTIALTNMIPVEFADEDNDQPRDPNPYGIAGWSENDLFVFVYDKYDIWRIDPAGARVPVCVTNTFGRRNQMQLRYLELDDELEFLPTEDEIILKAFDERSKSYGFYKAQLSTVRNPEMLVMDHYYFNDVKKAKNDKQLIWTKENVKVFPDLWRSNMEFVHAEKISDANPQQDNYIWPTIELVKWTSFSGEELEGLLYKPENFNPDLKYPMLVYFYERNSENLHRYQMPSPSRSTINETFYASNGYLVFVPDITYKVGYPGESAYNAIVSGTQALVNKRPYVDKENMALQGQSWGGYQTAWLITQTDLFAAAMAGAPVSNMTSAYGGIRWESGRSRMFQYEHTQSRIGGTLWEKPLHYIENSPLFYIPKIKTPLLMMHNDSDGAVPWYQGIEMFVAMRRMDKPVWMLTYNNEPHNLKRSSWANRIDLSTRMFQFFNHYLKDKPMPEWMESGIKAVDKGKKLGY